MNYTQLNEQVSVSSQLDVDDVAELKSKGVEMLVCNRPDDEDEGQTPYKVIFSAAQNQGMQTELLAFSSYQIQEQDRDQLVALIKQNKRMHLYCRSGSRSRRLWRMANKIGRGGHEYEAS